MPPGFDLPTALPIDHTDPSRSVTTREGTIIMLLRPEEMHLYSERERTRLAAQRYALLESIRNQRRRERAERASAHRRRRLARFVKRARVRSAGWLSRVGR